MTNDTNAFAAALRDFDACTVAGGLINGLEPETREKIRLLLQQAADPNLVTVPREPTEAMINAGLNDLKSSGCQFVAECDARDCFKAMLSAAAPTDQHPKQDIRTTFDNLKKIVDGEYDSPATDQPTKEAGDE